MALLKPTVHLLQETVQEWMEDGGARIAAALAYYAVFSLSPLLIIISLVVGLVMSPNTVETSLVSGLQSTLGQQAGDLIRTLLQNHARSTDLTGTIVWLAIVIWGATGMFAQLQNALDMIWEVKAKPGRSPLMLIRNRILSFGIVILAAVALLGTMVINSALNTLVDRASQTAASLTSVAAMLHPLGASTTISAAGTPSELALRGFQLLLTVAISTGLIAVIFRVLPDVEISWGDVIVGSIFTAVLEFIGQFAVGLYLSRASIATVFGAAGSLTVILVWVYYSAQILLFGAEFTQVWARHYGYYIRPDSNAVWESEEAEREEEVKTGLDLVEGSAAPKR